MIKRLRLKFVLVIMAVVTMILLAIFFTMLTSTQNNNERMSIGMLQQALNARPPHYDRPLPQPRENPNPRGMDAPNLRVPVLIISVNRAGTVSTVSNQLHFIEDEDITPIAELALKGDKDTGIVPNYALRYLRKSTENGIIIALADISIEKEILSTQIKNSLLTGSGALLLFFFLSLLLAHWAVHPVEVAWEKQQQFIANASHELKTPLTVILSNVDILGTNMSGNDEKNIRRMEHIQAEALRMKRLVEEMLMLAKSDHAVSQSIFSLVDFSYAVKNAVLVYEPIAFDEKKKLEYSIENALSVMGDLQRLQQAIHALLDNALKYSPANGTIHVSLSQSEHRTVLLKVSNGGDLIPTDELERIFLRFYRRDPSRSEHESFGLGLSIAQSIVLEHKGKIWAQSDAESGNSFYVSLPLTT